ncbi:MAG TPA: AMP-binding protein, partial [Bryobacteraceae bacterium]|nr:AMP-binding protein [Bryobacteraceae bacterium]
MPETELRFDFFDALNNHAGSRPDEIALAVTGPEGNASLSWSKLTAEIRGVSLYLQEMGIVPGDRVAILMENQPRWGVAFAAVQSAGAIAVPLDTISGIAAAIAVCRHADTQFLLASPQLSSVACEVQAEVCTITGTITTEAEWSLAASGGSSDTALPLVRRTLEDPLAILYTGGTTGKPKGVLLTQRNLYRSITDMLRVFPLSPADRILSVLPLFHVMPLLSNLLAPLFTGAQVLFLNQLDPQSLMNAFASQGITAFLCVPQFYYQMERRILGEVSRQSVA